MEKSRLTGDSFGEAIGKEIMGRDRVMELITKWRSQGVGEKWIEIFAERNSVSPESDKNKDCNS